jgi:antitoxin component of MazEF toxin-antitoxin module
MSAQSILKWGNSLAFRIPSAIAKQIGLTEGAQVEFHLDGKRLVIEPADKMPAFTHRDLVEALQKTKRRLIDFGPPQGNELL